MEIDQNNDLRWEGWRYEGVIKAQKYAPSLGPLAFLFGSVCPYLCGHIHQIYP